MECQSAPPEAQLYHCVEVPRGVSCFIEDGCIISGDSRPTYPAQLEAWRVFHDTHISNDSLRLTKGGNGVVFTFSGSE